MAAGIEIYNYVTNQKGSPALYSDVFANRPAAGFIGRLFISTDTLEIYRDNGTTWDLISGGGGPSVNIYNSDGTLLADRTMTMAGYNLIFEGGAGTNRVRMSANAGQARIFSFASANVARWAFRVDGAETGSNAGADWALRSYNDAGAFTRNPIAVRRSNGEKSFLAEMTLTAGTEVLTGTYSIAGATYLNGLTMTGGNPHGAEHNNFTLANAGSLTFANSIYLGAQSNVLRLQGNASGTITMQAASPGIRTAASTLNQIQYNTSTGAALTYTHAAVMQALGIYRLSAAGSLTITNAYGLIVNDLNEYGYSSGSLAITNRWGIYQDSTTDLNYFGGNVLIGNTVSNGNKLQVTGGAFISQDLLIRGTHNPYAAANRGIIAMNGSGGNLLSFSASTTTHGYLFVTNTVYEFNCVANQTFNVFTGGVYQLQISNTGNFLLSAASVGTSATRTIALTSGVAPGSSPADLAQLYVNDITAGNAAFHTRTENGAVVKLYQETTGVAAATFAANTGTAVNDASTFDGYTLGHIVKALRNQGFLA